MTDFQFLKNPISNKWVILSVPRAKRPDVARGAEPICPFCLGREKDEPELFRIGGTSGNPDWQIRVVHNKYPFTPIHEIIVHSPDHHKNFDELPEDQVVLIIQTYRQRFQTHKDQGQVVIFHNHGEVGGESLPHPHTQLAVVPRDVELDMPRLEEIDTPEGDGKALESSYFALFCPKTAQWPDEVWVVPKLRGRMFFEIADGQIEDLAFILQKLVQIFTQVYGHEFPYNFYIYPGGDWYLRFIPRSKSIGGFELSTGIFVNIKDPQDTIEFLKKEFASLGY